SACKPEPRHSACSRCNRFDTRMKSAGAMAEREHPMNQKTSPSPRIKPLPPEHCPELKDQFETMRRNLGFIPNSILIMQRKPKLAKALAQMTAAVWDPEGEVDRGFKRIIAHVASRAAGCQYCMAHTAGGALHFGVEDKKLSAVWDYQ